MFEPDTGSREEEEVPYKLMYLNYEIKLHPCE